MNNSDFNAEATYQQAIQAYQSGQILLAEQLLTKIAEHEPNNDGILATLGGILLANQKIAKGIEKLKAAININPNNIEAQINLSIAYQQLGQDEEAINQFKHLTTIAPNRGDVHFNYANALLKNQQYEEALTALYKTIEVVPELVQAYQTLGSVLTYLERHEAAISIYKKCLAINPNDINIQIQLAQIYIDTDVSEKAIETLEKAVEVHSSHFAPYAVLGKYLIDLGKTEDGEGYLRKAIGLNPNDIEVNLTLANICKTLNKTEEAISLFDKVLKIDPNNERAIREKSSILSTKIPYWHFEMLADTARNDAYQKAIEKVVSKKTSILDIGAGSGLLSMMAARVGAKNVVACEMHTDLAQTAQKIIEKNNYQQQIKLYNKKSTFLKVGKELPERVDIIISEILDVGGIGEGAIPSIRHATEHLAKKNVTLIPAKFNLFGQLIEIPARSRVAPIRQVSGFDLSEFNRYRIPDEYNSIMLKAEKYKALSPVLPLLNIDFYNLPPVYSITQPNIIPLSFPITASGELQAIVFWFDLYLDNEIVVSSKVDGELEHWGQALFCFPNPKTVKADEEQAITMLQSDLNLKFRII